MKHDARVQCHSETDCEESVNCNGRMAQCPSPRKKRDHKQCNEGTKVELEITFFLFKIIVKKSGINGAENHLYLHLMFLL